MARKYLLRELCEIDITDGTHQTPTYSTHGYIFLSSKNVTSGKIDWDNVMYIPEWLHKELYQRISPQKDDILLAKNGTTGVAAIVDREEIFDIYVSLALIRPNKDMILPQYLLYAINSDASKRYFDSHLKGIGVPNLHLTHIRDTPITVPSLEKQRHIVAILDTVSNLIAMRKQQLAKLEELVKARFVEMFGDPLSNSRGWPLSTVTEVCHAIFGGGTPSKSHLEYFTGTIPWVTPKDMKMSVISDSIDHITEGAVAHSTTNLVPPNSVLMVIRSGILKHTLPVAINSVPVTINQDMKAFVPNEVVTTAFLMHFFKAITSDVLAGVRGVTADNIDFKAFQKRTIILPPMELQEQFTAFVDQTYKSRLTIQQGLDKLEIMKKAMIQRYFGGGY